MSRVLAAAYVPLHRWAGLIFGWVLFGVFFTGALTVFGPEISYWATPSLHDAERPGRAEVLDRGLGWLEENASDSRIWRLTFPDARAPTIGIIHRGDDGSQVLRLHPDTLQPVSPNADGDGLFFGYHYSLNISRRVNPVAFYVVGAASIAFIVIAISGLVVRGKILKDLFRMRLGGSLSRAAMDIHVLAGVLTLLFHIMILISGLWLIYWVYMPAGVNAVYDGKAGEHRKEIVQDGVQDVTSPPGPVVETLPVPVLLGRAEQIMGEGKASHFFIRDTGRDTMLMEVWRRRDDRIGQQVERVLLDGHTGDVLRHLQSRSGPLTAHSIMAGLHMAEFGGFPLRLFYYVCSLAGALVIGAGMVRFVSKRARPDRPQPFWMRGITALSIASSLGLIWACATYMFTLRFSISGSLADTFFTLTLGLSLTHALLRPLKQALSEQALFAAFFCILAAVWPGSQGISWSIFAEGDWMRTGVVCGLLVWATGLVVFGLAVRRSLRSANN